MRKIKKKLQKKGRQILNDLSGVTMIELVVALIILTIIISISFSIYINYINKAKITLAVSLLENTRKDLNAYNLDKGKYPKSINFNNCTDENGSIIFSSGICERFRNDISSVENYSSDNENYILSVRAKDPKKTLIILENNKVSVQVD